MVTDLDAQAERNDGQPHGKTSHSFHRAEQAAREAEPVKKTEKECDASLPAPRLRWSTITFCRATNTMLAAIIGSTILLGSLTTFSTESVSVSDART